MTVSCGKPSALRILAWAAFAAAVAWTFWSGLVPVSSLPRVSMWDKAAHAVNYALLAVLLWAATRGRRPWLSAFLLVCLGALVEVAQSLTGYRTGDWQDAVANAAGVLAAGMLLEGARRFSRR